MGRLGGRRVSSDPVSGDAFHLECTERCSLRPDSPHGDRVTSLLLEGKSYRAIVAALRADDVRIDLATISRHSKHVVRHAPEEVEVKSKATNIEILESIIAKGFDNRKNWKPTISDTMKAMDMWFRLTSGNPFDELLDTLAAAGIGDETPESMGIPSGVEAPSLEDDDA